MAWFRTNRGVAAWLACFALACQLVLSFGHVHIGKFSTGLIGQAAAQTTHKPADGPSSPQKAPAGHADDFCAICANISLAGTLILPVPALVPAPGFVIHIAGWSAAATVTASFDDRPFNARGPPHA